MAGLTRAQWLQSWRQAAAVCPDGYLQAAAAETDRMLAQETDPAVAAALADLGGVYSTVLEERTRFGEPTAELPADHPSPAAAVRSFAQMLARTE